MPTKADFRAAMQRIFDKTYREHGLGDAPFGFIKDSEGDVQCSYFADCGIGISLTEPTKELVLTTGHDNQGITNMLEHDSAISDAVQADLFPDLPPRPRKCSTSSTTSREPTTPSPPKSPTAPSR